MVSTRKAKASTRKSKVKNKGSYVLPTGRNKPDNNPWHYAYLITGEKKIGKTSFSIADCEEFVFQFDKPNSAKDIREQLINNWEHGIKVLTALEKEADDFPYDRVIIDGVNEWYSMCVKFSCKNLGIEHPSEAKWGRGWHDLGDNFLDVVNRLLRLQIKTETGLIFIAHANWKEVKAHSGEKLEKLVPDLPAACEKIINGKCDAWISYEKDRDKRVMVVNGGEESDVGHRIDGHFLTPEGKRIKEILMGDEPDEGMKNFINAFNNKQEYISYKEIRDKEKKTKTKPKTSRRSRRNSTSS